MINEQNRLGAEILTYCADADTLKQCRDWSDLEAWLVTSRTEAWHEHENLIPLREEYGDDFESAKSHLLIDYIAKNITRRYIAFRNSLEYERLEDEKTTGVIDTGQFHRESRELTRVHTHLYEHLGL